MAEENKNVSIGSVNAAVQAMPAVQVLQLYHAIETATDKEKAEANLNQDVVAAIESRAEYLLDKDTKVGDNMYANAFLYGSDDNAGLDAVKGTKEYKQAGQAAIDLLNTLANEAETNSEWMRDNYATAVAEFNEAAKDFAEETGTEQISFEKGTKYSVGNPDWVVDMQEQLIDRYGSVRKVDDRGIVTDEVDTSNMSEEALAAYQKMVAITDELEKHSFVGDDKQLGANGFLNTDAEEYRAGGTSGIRDDLAGIGEAEAGTGIGRGEGGRGVGAGKGNGYGDGDGEGGSISSAEAKKALTNTAVGAGNADGSVATNDSLANAIPEDSAISKYAESMIAEDSVNHIFGNSYYNSKPVPKWSFSIDFIPTIGLVNSLGETSYDVSKLLTKSVIRTTLPQRTMTSVVSNFKGASIELPARAVTAGTLNMTFAENESFVVANALDSLLEYAASDAFKEFDNSNTFITYAQRAYANMVDTVEPEKKPSWEDFLAQQQILKSYRKYLADKAHQFNIVVKLYKSADTVAFGMLGEDAWPTLVYYFAGCDVQQVDRFDLDYTQDSPIDINCSFMYQYFEELTYQEYMVRYGTAPQSAEDAPPTASDDEMIDFADAMSDLAELENLEYDLYEASDEEMIAAADAAIGGKVDEAWDAEVKGEEVKQADPKLDNKTSSPQAAYDFINKSKLTGNARKEAALAAGITEEDYAAGQKLINQKYAKQKPAAPTPAPQSKPVQIDTSPEVQQFTEQMKQLYITSPNDTEGKKQYTEVMKDLAEHGELTTEKVQKFNQDKKVLETASKFGTSTANAKQLMEMAPFLFK